jgi:hypothetical protein
MSVPPPPPARPEPTPPPSGSWLSLTLAAAAGLAAVIGLGFLTLGYCLPALVVGVILFGVVAFHYFVWGWWLGKIIRDEELRGRGTDEKEKPE